MTSEPEQHVALPQLRGAPAYARPPMPVVPVPRPLDPDDLPIEAVRTDEERDLARGAQAGTVWTIVTRERQEADGAAGPPIAAVFQIETPHGNGGGAPAHQGSLQARKFGLRAFAERVRSGR